MANQPLNEAEIEAWIRTLDDEKDRNLVMWMERALRAEKELAEVNERLREQLMQSLADQAQELDMGY